MKGRNEKRSINEIKVGWKKDTSGEGPIVCWWGSVIVRCLRRLAPLQKRSSDILALLDNV